MAVATFYRVLEDAPTFVDGASVPNNNSTARRWSRREFNSTHNAVPTDWVNGWNQGLRNFHQFNLLCADGLHTVAALLAFLNAAAGHEVLPLGNVPGGDPYIIGELDGTCAFTTREEAWDYVLGEGGLGGTVAQILTAGIVEFTGLEMGIVIPENLKGGVQVKVVNAGRPAKAAHYAQHHHLPIPDELAAILNPQN